MRPGRRRPSEPTELVEWPQRPDPGYAVAPSRISLFARLSTSGLPIAVERLGLYEVRCRLQAAAIASLGDAIPEDGERCALTLILGYRTLGPFAAVVHHEPEAADNLLLRCRLDHEDHAAVVALQDVLISLRARGALVPSQTRIARTTVLTDPDRVRQQLRALAGYGAPGLLLPAHGVPWSVRLVDCDAKAELALGFELRGPPPEPGFHLELCGYNAVFRMVASRGAEREGLLRVALPEELVQVRRRWRRRAPAPDGLAIAYRHPRWPGHEQVRRLRDVSTHGLGVWAFPEADLLDPGTSLRNVAILYRGEVVCEGDAVVHHLTELPVTLHQGGEALCGMRFQPTSTGDDARWLNLVHHLLNPNTRSGASWSLQSWSVYQDSGYFNLSGKEPQQFERLRGSFREVSRGLDAAPWLGCQAVWPSDRGVEATFTFVKVYGSTWFGYQLAKSPDRPDPEVAEPRRVLRELYFRVFEHMQHDRELNWVAGYLEASVSWNQVAQFAWAQERLPSGDACLLDFHLMEGSVGDFTAAAPEGIHLGAADQGARDALLDHLATTRPLAFRSALDLTPEALDFETIRRLWQSAGLRRERGLVAAYDAEDRAVAVAVVEIGETGASLFSLLDSVRLFALAEDGERCFPALLASAAHSFARQNKERFVFYRERWDAEAALATGLRDLGHGKFWAIRRELLPDFLEHVAALLPPRPSPLARRGAAV